ncbi:MAG: mercuric reductase [Gemmatimonadota bacterium]
MSEVISYDAIVLGAGQAGGPLSTTLARAGRKTALVERAHVGGTCVNEGCTPTKTMVASARVAHLARRAAAYGVRVGDVSVDLAVVRRRKRDIVESFRGGSERGIESTDGLDLYTGEGRFTAAHEMAVRTSDGAEKRLSADLIFINAGARPSIPDLPGLDRVPYLDSTSVMELGEVPEHLVVIGGGYIGLEFGQMFRRFGSRVTIVQRAERLLPREDADVSDAVADILRDEGIDVRLGTEPTGVAASGEGDDLRIDLRASGGLDGSGGAIEGSHLLVAAGRVPNSDRLDLAAAGIRASDRGFVVVNERLETSVPGVFALGDIKGGPAFTHIAYDDFRILRTNLLEGGSASTAGRLVPYTVFIDPQLGRVGMGEEEARAAGREVRVAKLPMTRVARALETDETRGFMKAVLDAETDEILGCAVLGVEGGEVMTVVQMAMMGGVRWPAIRDGVFAHPTLAESLNNLFMTLGR